MNKRANIVEIHNGKRSEYKNSRGLDITPFMRVGPIMPKEVEKDIILDAIESFILSCDAEEADDFIKDVTNKIVKARTVVFDYLTKRRHV